MVGKLADHREHGKPNKEVCKERLMFKKGNRFYADWRNRQGERRRKAFTTVEAASSYEEQQKNAVRSMERPEYDLSAGVRGKSAAQYADGAKLVRLEPDVHEVFPDSESVNAALRMVMRAGARAATAKVKRAS
jgi:hypothetical protein